jgi:hypothetical protein
VIELFVLLWTIEVVALVASGPALVSCLDARRARRDLPRAQLLAYKQRRQQRAVYR